MKKVVKITAGVVVLLVAIVVVGLFAGNAKEKKLGTARTKVDEVLKTNDSCSESSIQNLEKLYKDENEVVNKALRAEQIAVCYSVNQKYAESKTWYETAKKDYEKAGNSEKAAQMEAAAAHADLLGSQPPIVEEGLENVDDSVGQN